METPYYLYDMNLLDTTLEQAQVAAELYNIKLLYAIKANTNPYILERIRKYGFGIDAVSIGEIKLALTNGFQSYQIAFAGSGKTKREIDEALQLNIATIHCESLSEWEYISSVYPTECTTKIALRVIPNVYTNTHQHIQTGGNNHKFGISTEEASRLIQKLIERNSTLLPCGFHFHVGSQITRMDYFEELSRSVLYFFQTLPSSFSFDYINLGGGLGINYDDPDNEMIPNFTGWMRAIRPYFPQDRFPHVYLEPGRSLVGQCGKLITEVQYIKNRQDEKIVILDTGMNDLLRPALYGARHHISPMQPHSETTQFQTYTLSGPSCESTDCFGKNYSLPELKEGDHIVIHSCGAYAESMRLNYTQRLAPSCVYKEGNNLNMYTSQRKKIKVEQSF